MKYKLKPRKFLANVKEIRDKYHDLLVELGDLRAELMNIFNGKSGEIKITPYIVYGRGVVDRLRSDGIFPWVTNGETVARLSSLDISDQLYILRDAAIHANAMQKRKRRTSQKT